MKVDLILPINKNTFIIVFLLLLYHGVHAQIYFTRTGNISFYSDTPLEKIDALNRSSTIILDFETGKVESATLIKGFQFEKALMQEHFNENYMESNKYPKAVFQGKFMNYEFIDPEKTGTHACQVVGELTIRDKTKQIEAPCSIEIKDGSVHVNTVFEVQVADFGITIPSVVRDKIAKTLEVKVVGQLEKLSK